MLVNTNYLIEISWLSNDGWRRYSIWFRISRNGSDAFVLCLFLDPEFLNHFLPSFYSRNSFILLRLYFLYPIFFTDNVTISTGVTFIWIIWCDTLNRCTYISSPRLLMTDWGQITIISTKYMIIWCILTLNKFIPFFIEEKILVLQRYNFVWLVCWN